MCLKTHGEYPKESSDGAHEQDVEIKVEATDIIEFGVDRAMSLIWSIFKGGCLQVVSGGVLSLGEEDEDLSKSVDV